MQRLKVLGLALVAVFAMSAVASASAHEFVASKTGSLAGKALNVHKFKTNAGTVECTTATPKGSVAALKTETQEVEVEYSGCTFTVFGTKKATVTPNPKYLFSANEWVSVLNPSTTPIVIEVEGTGCNIKVSGSSTSNHELKEVKYVTKEVEREIEGKKVKVKDLEVKSKVSGITYTTTNGLCGSGGTNGTYEGNEEVELVGGSIEWK
jgi:hypothetical protein